MDTARLRRIPLVTALLAGVGALLMSFISYLFILMGGDFVVRGVFAPDPVGWPFTPRPDALIVAATVIALLLIVGLTWLFVRFVVRGAMPGRGAAVFFGTWGAVIIAGWIAGLVRAPLMLVAYRIPAEQLQNYAPQFAQLSTTGALWALMWGWLAALIAALLHRAARPAGAPEHSAPAYGAPTYGAPAYGTPSHGAPYPQGSSAPYADSSTPAYPPAPPTA